MRLNSVTQPTFMLVAPFTFNPDTSPLKLGCLLGPKKGSRSGALPDPLRLFSSTSNLLPIPSTVVPTSQVDPSFHVDVGESSGFGAHLEADTSILSGIGAKLGLTWQRNWSIDIDCREVGRFETTTFEPSTDYIKQAVAKNDLVRDYLTKGGGLRLRHRPVYMITGLMIVRGQAKIAIVEDRSRKFEAGASTDLIAASSGIVPLNAGTSSSVDKEKSSRRDRTFEGPFILAYRLRRIKTTRRGEFVSEEDYNAFALMDGDKTSSNKITLEHEAVSLESLNRATDESSSDSDSI